MAAPSGRSLVNQPRPRTAQRTPIAVRRGTPIESFRCAGRSKARQAPPSPLGSRSFHLLLLALVAACGVGILAVPEANAMSLAGPALILVGLALSHLLTVDGSGDRQGRDRMTAITGDRSRDRTVRSPGPRSDARLSRGGGNVPTEFLTVTSVRAGTSVVVQLAGAFDLPSVPKFTAAVDQVLAGRPTRVEIDASWLGFTDSSALDALVRAQRQAAELGAELRIARASEGLHRLLALTGLHPVLCDDTP